MRSPVVELLAGLALALDGARTPWFLFGAQAAILHGSARLTADVDVTVRLPDTLSNQALSQALERCRFQRRVVDPTFVERTHIFHSFTFPRGFRWTSFSRDLASNTFSSSGSSRVRSMACRCVSPRRRTSSS